MIKQNKGRDITRISKRNEHVGPWFVSKKYDGHYVQIKFDGIDVRFWTSGGKEFFLSDMADYIATNISKPFHIECEFNHNCKGLLGDRGKSAILTTYRTNLAKGIKTCGSPTKDIFRIIDIVDSDKQFTNRLQMIKELFGEHDDEWFELIDHHFVDTMADALVMSRDWVEDGYEGAMLRSPTHTYKEGKRVNDIVKIKNRHTADLLCIYYKPGKGKYEGHIGSLTLEDSYGRVVDVGSGLTDDERMVDPSEYIGKVIEIEYERIDTTYIQPIIKTIRYDKTADEID